MFSPSGRLSQFSGKKRIEDVIARFVNLPEHERGRLQNQEFLNRALKKLKCESELANHLTSPGNISSVEDLQMEIHRWQMQLEDAERRLRCLEADPHMITSLQEAEYYERMLEESLNRVRLSNCWKKIRWLPSTKRACSYTYKTRIQTVQVPVTVKCSVGLHKEIRNQVFRIF